MNTILIILLFDGIFASPS